MSKVGQYKKKGAGSQSPPPSYKRVRKSAFVARANPVLLKDRVQESITLAFAPIVEDYARFLNQSDDLQHELLHVITASPTSGSILAQKHRLAMGVGFVAWKGKKSLFTEQKEAASEAERMRIDGVAVEVNADGQSIADVLSDVLRDYLLFGNAFVMFSKGEDDRVFCHHVPFVQAKPHRRNEAGDVEHIGICADWKNWSTATAKKYSTYPNYQPDVNGVERCVLHIKEYRPGMDYYGLPDHITGLLAATLEYYIDRRNLSKLENANIPSGILQFFGASTAEEAKEIVDDAKRQFAGVGKNGGLLVQALADADLKAVFTAIENAEREGEMLELQNTVAQKIITAHVWTASLAGIATAGQLGSNQQLVQEFQYVQAVSIQPLQTLMLDKFINIFLAENDIKDLVLTIENATPVTFFGDVSPSEVLTIDERREEMGFAPQPVIASNEFTEIREAVNSFSPLVANKVLDALDPDELRGMVGLETSKQNGDTNTGQ